jgi:hypothetical protein
MVKKKEIVQTKLKRTDLIHLIEKVKKRVLYETMMTSLVHG